MLSSPPRARLSPLPVGIRMLRNTEVQVLEERYPWAAVSVADCITCGGNDPRTFRWWDATGQVVEYDCACEDQYLLYRYLLHCGVMPKYQRLGWGDFIAPDPEAVNAIGHYHDNRERYVKAGMGMILSGTKGNGKSLLGFLMLKQLIGDGVDCYATSFSDMIDHFADGWRNRDQSRWFNHTVRNAGVLYIDDLGRERTTGPASVGENMLEVVVRSRVACQQPTLISTNLTEQDIGAGYGGHTMSLLSEQSLFVQVRGPDRRIEVRQRFDTEVLQGLTRPIVVS